MRDGREWWVYTPESWPKPIAGPYASYDEAYEAAAWLVGAEDFRIDWADAKDAGVKGITT